MASRCAPRPNRVTACPARCKKPPNTDPSAPAPATSIALIDARLVDHRPRFKPRPLARCAVHTAYIFCFPIDCAVPIIPAVLAVVLAAGRGTRMGALTATIPKPLLHLCGRPIIEHILLGLRSAGVHETIVITGYRGEQIEAYLGDGTRLGMRLSYRRQERAEGTGRALLLVRDVLGAQSFLLSWGDVVVDAAEYGALRADFTRVPCDTLLSVNAIDDPWRGAAVYVDGDGRVTGLVEKPPRGSSTTRWNNAGVFAFTPLILDYAGRLTPSPRGEYELPQAIAAMLADGHVIRAHALRGFWSDLGTPEDLTAAERAFRPLDAPPGSAALHD
ncbi:MAG TPA: nucleotidyltransferase family protein [Candidatus Acidoferrales bacterium]|nr:nucleotidyltransferase family protein [Candidatus Acidoferrales bacterium]